MTLAEMSELAAQYLSEKSGVRVTAEQLYHASPRGELGHIAEIYWESCAYYGRWTHDKLPESPGYGQVAIVPEGSSGVVYYYMGEWNKMFETRVKS